WCRNDVTCRISSRFGLRDDSLRSAAKNGGSEGSPRQSAIHHQLDHVDVRRIVRCKKKHSLGHIFRLAPTGKWNRGREEVGNFADSSAVALARAPRFQMGVFVAPGATTFTRILRGARSAAMDRAIETSPPFVAAYAARPALPR